MTHLPLTRRQREILDFLSQFVQRHGISPTLEEIARNFGVNRVTIFGHVRELERKGVIRRAAPGISRAIVPVHPVGDGGSPPARLSVPILGQVAAGRPIEAVESPEELDLSELIDHAREVFALRVRGNSMIDDAICDGDIVLVERRTTARNGETVVAVLPGGEVTLKRLYREKAGFRLQPANSALAPLHVPEVEVRGVVIGVLRRY